MDGARLAVSLLGSGVALVLFLMSTFAWPDDGATVSWVLEGITITLIFAAVPIAILAPTVTATSLVALGGGMTIAGFATTPGGNLLGPIMAAIGLLVLLTGASKKPAMTPGIIATMLACALALSVAMYAGVGTASLWQTLLAVVLAGAVAVSTRFIPDGRVEPSPLKKLPKRPQGG